MLSFPTIASPVVPEADNNSYKEDFPESTPYKNRLAASYGLLGKTYKSMGNYDNALTFFEKYSFTLRVIADLAARRNRVSVGVILILRSYSLKISEQSAIILQD